MNRGVKFSKPLASAAAAAMVAACALSWAQIEKRAEISDQSRRGSARETELSSQIAERSEFDDSSLGRLRKRADQFRGRLGSAGTWERAVNRLGAAWLVASVRQEDRLGCKVQTGTFSLSSTSVGIWPDIVSAVGDLETIPGVGVVKFEMRTSGNVDRRSLDIARIILVVRTSSSTAALHSP
jgi:hypothetical protein